MPKHILDTTPLTKRGWTKEQAEIYMQIQRQIDKIDDQLKEITNPIVYTEKYKELITLAECSRNLAANFDAKEINNATS